MDTHFNFNSAICTSREQSERLLALGLKKETADAIIPIKFNPDKGPILVPQDYWISDDPFYLNIREGSIPAWSLDRLREMLNKSGVTISFVERDTSIIVERYGVFQNLCEIWDNVYDNICDAIEWLIKEGYFNENYLV